MYPEVHKVSKRLRAPEEVEEVDREGSQDKREDKETAKYPISATSDHGRRPGYLLKTVSHPCGLKVTDRLTDVSVDVLPVLAGTVLVRAVSCPGSHPTVDRPRCGLWPSRLGWSPQMSPGRVVSRLAPDRRPARWLAQGQ